MVQNADMAMRKVAQWGIGVDHVIGAWIVFGECHDVLQAFEK